MEPFTGILLVLGLMTLIFLGPEWAVAISREVRSHMKIGPPN